MHNLSKNTNKLYMSEAASQCTSMVECFNLIKSYCALNKTFEAINLSIYTVFLSFLPITQTVG